MYGLKHSDSLSLCYCIPSCFILVQASGDDSTDAQLWIAFSDVAIDCKESIDAQLWMGIAVFMLTISENIWSMVLVKHKVPLILGH